MYIQGRRSDIEMKKKILFVTNHFRFSNGVATVLRNLIANLDENEYDTKKSSL